MKTYKTELIQPLGDHNPKSECIPTSEVREYLELPFTHLNPLQTEFMQYLEEDEKNIVVAAPTSSGKTLCAELFASRSLMQNKKVLYLAPMKALADEKYDEWSSPGHSFAKKRIEIMTGDFEMTDAKKASLNLADIIVLTPEMFNSKCRSFSNYEGWLKNSSVIVDEAHLIGMEGRGDSLECGIIQFFENSINSRILLISATIPNVKDFGTWLNHITGRESELIVSQYRPCKLNVEYQIFEDTNHGRKMYYGEIEDSRLNAVTELVMRHKEEPTLVFVGNKDFGRKLCKRLDAVGVDHYFHNADIDRESRVKIEKGFRELEFKVLVASPTLAWGVNTPARYVICAHTAFGLTPMHPANVLQEIGRAGRAGYAKQGDAIIMIPETKFKEEVSRLTTEYQVESVLNDVEILMFHVISYICDGTIKNAEDLDNWYHKTLSSIQKNHIDKTSAQKVLDNLVFRLMINQKEDGDYAATKLGQIAARMYMSPIDLSDWFRNFCKIDRLIPDSRAQAEQVYLKVAEALGSCYSYGITWRSKNEMSQNIKAYMTKREKDCPAVLSIANKLNKQIEYNPQLKYIAIFHSLLMGREIDSALNSTSWGIMKDVERITQTLRMVDDQCGKMMKASGKVRGYGWGKQWDLLQTQLKYGVGYELINLVRLPGIGKEKAKKLAKAGIMNKSQMMSREVESKKILGLKTYEKAIGEVI